MIRLLFFGLVIAVCLVAFMAFSAGKNQRERPIDVDPVDSSSDKASKGRKETDSGQNPDDDIIDVEPIEDERR